MKKMNKYYEIATKFFKKSCELIEFDTKEEWLQLRKQGIGGSDLAPILGHSRYRNAKDIYKSKNEDVEQINNFAIDFGNRFEPIIFEAFKNKYKDIFAVLDFKNIMFRNIWFPFLQASLDGVLVYKQTEQVGILEIKSCQQRKGKWYDNFGNKVVPQDYFDQAIHYFNTTNAEFVVFYILVNYENPQNDRDMEFLTPRIYWKKDCLDYCNHCLAECDKFWNNYVLKKIEPNNKIVFN